MTLGLSVAPTLAGLRVLAHKGDEAHAASHIDYILISERNASAVRKFGIDADRDPMVDFDHAVLFTDVDMCQVLWGLSGPHLGRRCL